MPDKRDAQERRGDFNEIYGAYSNSLAAESALRCAARKHSLDMFDRDFFSHTNPDGEGPGQRLTKAGYSGGWGENIAWGQSTPAQVVDSWMNSDGHCANIMRASYTKIGIGYHSSRLWTTVFGN